MTSPRATASLVSEVDSVASGKPFRVALRLRLAPGWHTYWRNPGDAGVPPDLGFDLPPGVTAGEIDWPAPQRVPEGSLMTYAYTNELLLPVTITPAIGGPITLKAHANWLVCRDICVPEEAEFVLDLPAGVATPSAQAPLFAATDRRTPRPSPWLAVVGKEGTLSVEGPELIPASVSDAWFIPENPAAIRNSAAQPLSVWQGGLSLALSPGKSFSAEQGLSGVLSIRDRSGLETAIAVHAVPGSVELPQSAMGLQRMVGLAFLGGLILNLMPCVFPVLALKVVGLLGIERQKALRHAAAYTVGILVAFAALGGCLLVARAASAGAGWGFQFQSPVFVAAMAGLLFAVGLNLSGVYAIGSGLTRTGHGLAARPGLLGSFFTGLLAVVVATPCTAPFMGAAIAAGLASPPVFSMLVFLAMGVGLAAPYALLALTPALTSIVPRPGRWMELLRQALAFPMYGACAWLIWVVSQEAGPPGVLATGAGLVLLGFAGWVLGITQTNASRGRRLAQSAAVAAVLAAIAVLSGIPTTPGVAADRSVAGGEPFSAARLADLRAEGRAVFVNMTAAWCVTCLLNERVALSTEAVKRAFAEYNVTYLRGDWTRQDPQITSYLRENGRDGVPLYVYYPPRGQPTVLPQILTEGSILRELERG